MGAQRVLKGATETTAPRIDLRGVFPYQGGGGAT
jgi:hypothetical protein